MLERVIQNIEKYNMLTYGDHIIIGVSGGADSISLVHILHLLSSKYNLMLTAVHVNHCLRGEDADNDERYVVSFCESLNIPIKIFSCDITKEAEKTGLTLEEAGRKIRYRAFYDTLKEKSANKIAVAHNMNDNAETVLMRLCRGTGIKGLGGISPTRDNIIRPLINVSRDEIENYCNSHALKYCTDYTNNIDIYTRNKIRLHLLPWLRENLNNNIVSTLYKTSELLREEDIFMDNMAKRELEKCETSPSHINIEALKKYDPVLRRRIIRLAYIRYSKDLHDISYDHVQSVLSLLDKPTGKSVNLPHGLGAIREYDTIYIYNKEDKILDYSYTIALDSKTYIPEINRNVLISKTPQSISKNVYTIAFDYDKINGDLVLRTRKSGDKIYLQGLNGTKTLKKLFIDLKIPRNTRDTLPLLATGSDVLWLYENIISGTYIADENTNCKLYFYIWEDCTNEGNC